MSRSSLERSSVLMITLILNVGFLSMFQASQTNPMVGPRPACGGTHPARCMSHQR